MNNILSVRVTDKLKAALEKQAAKESRTVSSLVISILVSRLRIVKKAAK